MSKELTQKELLILWLDAYRGVCWTHGHHSAKAKNTAKGLTSCIKSLEDEPGIVSETQDTHSDQWDYYLTYVGD